MVARIIPKNYRNVTGRLASPKNRRLVGFESMLEKDFYLLLEFDINVETFEEQPVTLRYRGPDGQLHLQQLLHERNGGDHVHVRDHGRCLPARR